MARISNTAIIALPLAILAGVMLGESTVDAMQITRAPMVDAGAGARWARENHPADGDACPSPSLAFQSACVAITSN